MESVFSGDHSDRVVRKNQQLDIASPQFDPNQYLSVNHARTSFANLQTELKTLKCTTSDKTEQLKALVSAHFDQYLSSHEAVRSLADELRSHEPEHGELMTNMRELKQITDATLSVMLTRSKEQRKIRNAIGVLARFRPVLELTSKMKKCLQSKDYEKLAEHYCKFKYHVAKTNVVALQQAFEAAQGIALTANKELLDAFNDISLSVKDQRRAIGVLETLALVDKPKLTCLKKQFEYLHKRLTHLESQASTLLQNTLLSTRTRSSSSNSSYHSVAPVVAPLVETEVDPNGAEKETLVRETCVIIARFRNGLWSLLCELFKSSTLLSSEAETIQQNARDVITRSIQLLKSLCGGGGSDGQQQQQQQYRQFELTSKQLRLLNESFCEVQSLRKCPNANSLNARIQEHKGSFCDVFRLQVASKFLNQQVTRHSRRVFSKYFEEQPLSAAEQEACGCAVLSPKIQMVLKQARIACQQMTKVSMLSSENRIELTKASVGSMISQDLLVSWQEIWNSIGDALVQMAETSDDGGAKEVADAATITTTTTTTTTTTKQSSTSFVNASGTSSSVAAASSSSGNAAQEGTFRRTIAGELATCMLSWLRKFFDEVLHHFIHDVELSIARNAASSSTVTRQKNDAAMLFVIVSNCFELRAKAVSQVAHWIKTLDANTAINCVNDLTAFLASVEDQCVTKYVGCHLPKMQEILAMAPNEEEQRLRSHSTTNSTATTTTPTTTSSSSQVVNSAMPLFPTDCRQYVFKVLLLLIQLRSEVENSLGSFEICPAFVKRVLSRFTCLIADTLEQLMTSTPLKDTMDYTRVQLLVELRFFTFALETSVDDETKRRFAALEKQFTALKLNEKAISAVQTHLGQIKHQTKLYVLCLGKQC